MNGRRLLKNERKIRMTKTKIIDLKLELGKIYKGRVRTKQTSIGPVCHLDIEGEGEYHINMPVWLDDDYTGSISFSRIGSGGQARLVPYNTGDSYVKTTKTETVVKCRGIETISNEHILINFSMAEKYFKFARENFDNATVDFIDAGLKNCRVNI